LTVTKAETKATNAKKVLVSASPAEFFEQTTFIIQAKSFTKPSAAEPFVAALGESPWFKENLRPKAGIRLKENQSSIADADDPNKITILFTVECYAERKL
jgi:hypothetical protein